MNAANADRPERLEKKRLPLLLDVLVLVCSRAGSCTVWDVHRHATTFTFTYACAYTYTNINM